MWDITSSTTLTALQLLLVAFALCGVIGAERQYHQKNAGLRTHILVGTGSAVFTLVSVYGFVEMTGNTIPHDPARIAAQVVTGIGFLGAGVIFTRRDVVRGLTTAASIWVAAAVGMAAGAGLPLLAVGATLLHLFAVMVLSPLARRMPTADRNRIVEVEYLDGQGVLRQVLAAATEMGFEVAIASSAGVDRPEGRAVRLTARFQGKPSQHDLLRAVAEVPGVLEVHTRHDDED